MKLTVFSGASEAMQEIESIQSLFELADEPFNDNGLGKPRIFRGQSDFSWGVCSSLFRSLKQDVAPTNWQGVEEEILRWFFKDAEHLANTHQRGFFRDRALAQHHGVPTSLLDWSRSPLVALYFAVANSAHDHLDGALFFAAAVTTLDFSQVPDSNFDFNRDFALLDPPALHERIVAQSSVFSFHGWPTQIGMDFLTVDYGPNSGIRKLRIPAERKSRLRSELYRFGVRPAVLFPGFDGIASDINQVLIETKFS